MIRGVEKRTIFLDDRDREEFLDRFGRLLRELGIACFAWALMPNHAHFVLRRDQAPLAKLMARLAGSHARRFNDRQERIGHLFQGRYNARLVADEAGLWRAVAYVMANPVRHRLIPPSALAAFRWSSYGAIVGARGGRPFESLREATRILAARSGEPECALQSVLIEGSPEDAGLEPEATEVLDDLIAETCARHGVPRVALSAKRPASVRAKVEICKLATAQLGVRPTQLARALEVSDSTVHRLLHRETEKGV